MDEQTKMKCRICGCSWNNACITEHGPCWWIEEDLCSACIEQSNAELCEHKNAETIEIGGTDEAITICHDCGDEL